MASDCDLTSERPERFSCAAVESNFLPVLGVAPLAGRNFTSQEDLPNGPRAALLTYSLWRSRFASDRGIVGRTIPLDGVPATVVGILPAQSIDAGVNHIDTSDFYGPHVTNSKFQRSTR